MNDENPYQSPETRADGQLTPESEEDTSRDSEDEELQSRLVKLTSFLTIADAQVCQAALRQQGIEAFLENEGSVAVNWLWSNAVGGVKLLVPHEHLETATRLIEEVDRQAASQKPEGDVTFECEECGKEVTFPAKCRGKVETCPKCFEYVDVPD